MIGRRHYSNTLVYLMAQFTTILFKSSFAVKMVRNSIFYVWKLISNSGFLMIDGAETMKKIVKIVTVL